MCAQILNSVYEETLRVWCTEFLLTWTLLAERSLILKRMALVMLWHICSYLSAVTSQFLFADLFTWPFFLNWESKDATDSQCSLKFLLLWQRHSESLPDLRFRTPPALPEEAVFMRCLLCEELILHQQWKGRASWLLDMPIKGHFFFQRRTSLGSHVLMRNINVKALWKSLG